MQRSDHPEQSVCYRASDQLVVTDTTTRLVIRLGVAYGSDLKKCVKCY